MGSQRDEKVIRDRLTKRQSPTGTHKLKSKLLSKKSQPQNHEEGVTRAEAQIVQELRREGTRGGPTTHGSRACKIWGHFLRKRTHANTDVDIYLKSKQVIHVYILLYILCTTSNIR